MKFLRTPSNILAAVLLLIIASAPLRSYYVTPGANSVAHDVGEHVLVGNVVDIDTGERTAKVILDALEVDGVAKDNRAQIRVPLYPTSGLGDRVSVYCTLEQPEPFDGFAYDIYLAIRDVYSVCSVSSAPFLVEEGADRSIGLHLAKLRQTMIGRMQHVYPEPTSTLLAGLLLGQADFSDVWQERFSITGTSHIVAASGYNVSLVIIVLLGLFAHLHIRRQHAVPIVFVGILVYAILAGLEPPVVRAAIMGSLLLLAKTIGRKTTVRNVFLAAVAGMLLCEPRLLLWDTGFQLSVLSTAALLWLAPKLEVRMTWLPNTLGVREALVGSLSATVLTFPLIIFSFGQISLVSPLVNLLVLPLVPYAMVFGALGAVIGSIVVLPAWALLNTALFIIRVIASVPHAAIIIPDALRIIFTIISIIIVVLVCRRLARFSVSLR